MSTEKQKLYNEIETLPDELTKQVINYIEYLKLYFLDSGAPDSVKINSREDLIEKLQKGLDDIKEGKVYSIEETFEELDNI